MRIIAGKYRSRKINAPEGMNTRPTLDQVREAVFSSLGGFFDGGTMLDLFSGSGAVGLEALSRGMDQAVFCDIDRKAIQAIKGNIAALKAEQQSLVWAMDFRKALSQSVAKGLRYDLIYLDPPYHFPDLDEVFQKIREGDLLKENGRIVLETKKDETVSVKEFEAYKEARYGIARITYLRRKTDE